MLHLDQQTKNMNFKLLLFISLIVNESVQGTVAPQGFISNPLTLYNLNPAYYGKLNSNRSRLEFNSQFQFSNYYTIDLVNHPIYRVEGVYHGQSVPGRNEVQINGNIQNYSLNGLHPLNQKGNWMMGFGGGVSIENIDYNFNGRHLNSGVSLIRKGQFGSIAMGINLKYDHYVSRKTEINNQYQSYPEISIKSHTLNADLGFRYSNRKENLNIGLSIFNLRKDYTGYFIFYKSTPNEKSTLYHLPYNHFLSFNTDHTIRLNKKNKIHNHFLISGQNDQNELNIGLVQFNSSFTHFYKNEREAGFGLNVQSQTLYLLLGPSVHYRNSRIRVQYSIQVDSFDQTIPVHELSINYQLGNLLK